MPNDSLHNEELLRQVAGGNEPAFNTLVAMHWERVFSQALTYTRSYQEAEEITQDIFLKLWNNRGKLTEINNFLDYLFILGRNLMISSLRKKIVHTVTVDPDHRIAAELLPDSQLETRQLMNILGKGIQLLPPQQKNVFRLARLEGLPYEEIAGQLKITKRTVRFHMVQALNFLREYIKNHLTELSILALAIATDLL